MPSEPVTIIRLAFVQRLQGLLMDAASAIDIAGTDETRRLADECRATVGQLGLVINKYPSGSAQ